MIGRDALAAEMRASLAKVRKRLEELTAVENPNTGHLGEIADATYAEYKLRKELERHGFTAS